MHSFSDRRPIYLLFQPPSFVVSISEFNPINEQVKWNI